jgi:hypothetical protein
MFTGIELGPDYCVLVCARRRGSSIEVTSFRLFEPGEWTTDLPSRTALLQDARRELGLPRRATVVAWDLAAFGTSSSEEMLRRAGFEVDDVLSASEALTLLSSTRLLVPPDGPIAWLSITGHGCALAVVRDHDLVYAHEFAWKIRASEQRAQAHLLRRYLYVAQLVPQVRRAMDVVREQQGATVETAVACGNIPDLRSFTMPLIEQLDIEFETLDSLEGLSVSGELGGRIGQAAPAIRLAGAAAVFGQSGAGAGATGWLGAAAGLMLAGGAVWWAVSVPGHPERVANSPVPEPPAVVSTQGRAAAPPPAVAPASIVEPVPASTAITEPAPQPRSTTGRVGENATDRPVAPAAQPLPTVGGILISHDRRLAVIDGSVRGVGDQIAGRIVSRIEPDAVVFREASGRLVRVHVRAKGGS